MMTYQDMVDYIRAGVQNGSWSAQAAADARELLTRERKAIREKLSEYEQKMAEARSQGLEEHARLIRDSMDMFTGHLIRSAGTRKDASIKTFENSVKEADKVIDKLTFKTVVDVPDGVAAFIGQIGTTDAPDVHNLLRGSNFARADFYDPDRAGNLSGATKGQYLVAEAFLEKAGLGERLSEFQAPKLSDEAYKSYQSNFEGDDPEFTGYSWSQDYVEDDERLQRLLDQTVAEMASAFGISEADKPQIALLRGVLQGTLVRGVQLDVAKRDKAAFQNLVDRKASGKEISEADVEAALKSGHSLSLTKHAILGDSAEALVQRKQEGLVNPTGGMTPEEAAAASVGQSILDTLEYDRIALRNGVDSTGRPIEKYPSKKDVLDSTIGKAYLARAGLRKQLADNPSFAEYARSRGLNVIPGQPPTPGQMRRFGRAIRRSPRRPIKPSGVMAELIVVDPDRTVTIGEGAEGRRVSFTVTDENGNTRYLTKNELEDLGNEALQDEDKYPIREIDLDNQNARDLLAQAVPGLEAEMQVIDRGYRSDNDAIANRFKGSSVLVNVKTGEVVLIGKDRKVVESVEAPDQIAQLKTYASNPEYAAIAADNDRSRRGEAGNALMAFDGRFSKGLRVDDVGIAIPEGVTMTANVARKKITGELGERKTGQSLAEFNMIGRDEDGNPTYSVINVRDIFGSPRALSRAERQSQQARRKAGAPGKRGREDYREEALPFDSAVTTAPAPAPAAPPAPVAEPAPAAESKTDSGLAKRPDAARAERTTPAPAPKTTATRETTATRDPAQPRISPSSEQTPTQKRDPFSGADLSGGDPKAGPSDEAMMDRFGQPFDVSNLIDDSTHDAVDAGDKFSPSGGPLESALAASSTLGAPASLPDTSRFGPPEAGAPRGEFARALGRISNLSDEPDDVLQPGLPRIVNITGVTPTETASTTPDFPRALRVRADNPREEKEEEEEEEDKDTGLPPTVARVPGAGMGLMTGAFSTIE